MSILKSVRTSEVGSQIKRSGIVLALYHQCLKTSS